MAAKVETVRSGQPNSSGAITITTTTSSINNTTHNNINDFFSPQQPQPPPSSFVPSMTTTITGIGATVLPTTASSALETSGTTATTATAAIPRPAKMKFSAIWDVDKTPTNCVPRLCRLNVTRLEVKPSVLLPDLPAAVLLAVKIQGRRRTLRSTEIPLQPNCNLVDLNMEFSLTYPHFLKRSNHIEIMLQRKKHYKNRTIPGYRTLAIARLDMNEVLQRPLDDLQFDGGQSMLDLCAPLGSNSSDQGQSSSEQKSTSVMTPIASLRLTSASEPVRVPTLMAKSDDDLSSGADEANAVATDSDDILDDDGGRGRHRNGRGAGGGSEKPAPKKNFKSMALGQQTKFKQKIVSLLKKMKVSGASVASAAREATGGLVSPTTSKPADYYLEEDYDREATSKNRKKGRRNSFPPHSSSASQTQQIEQSLEDLEAEIENWAPQSDDDSEGDGVSLAVTVQPAETTPKPSLRPFFFNDLRLSSEQLPLLIDEKPPQEKASSSKRQHTDSFPGGGASNDHQLAPSPPPAGPNLLPSPSKQSVPVPSLSAEKQPSNSGGVVGGQSVLLLEKPVSSTLSASKGASQLLQQAPSSTPQSRPVELPPHLALSPGIQLEHIFQTSTDMPGHVILVFDLSLTNLARACSSLPDGLNVVCASNLADVDVFFAEIARLLQKFSSKATSTSYSSLLTTTASPCQLKLVLCGSSDAFFATVTQSFVERFSSRLPDAASLVRLLPVPLLPGSAIAQLLGAVSYNYRAFVEAMQHDSSANPNLLLQVLQDILLLPGSLKRQLDLFGIPIGEVLLTIRDKSSDSKSGSRQVVLPFVCDVQVIIVRASSISTTTSSNLVMISNQQPSQLVQMVQQQPQPQTVTSAVAEATAASSSFASSAVGSNNWVESQQQQQQPSNGGDIQPSSMINVNVNNNTTPATAEFLSGSPPTNTSSVTTTTTTNTNQIVANAWSASGTPSGPHPTNSASGAVVVPSPDVSKDPNATSTSAAFDVNVDYWLEATVLSTGSTSGVSGANASISGPNSSATASSSSVLTSTASMTSQLGSSGGQSQTLLTGSGSQSSGPRTFNLRGSYRQMVVTRSLVHSSESPTPMLHPSAVTMIMSARDKKIKKIWLTRKSRDSIGGNNSNTGGDKGQTVVDGVNRLVCTVKSSSSGHKVIVCVDGVEFTGVKFFQISPVWHSHVKNLPVFTPSSVATLQ